MKIPFTSFVIPFDISKVSAGILTQSNKATILFGFLLGWKLTAGDRFHSRILRISISWVLIAMAVRYMNMSNDVLENHLINREAYTMSGLLALTLLCALVFLWVGKLAEAASQALFNVGDANIETGISFKNDSKMDQLANLVRAGKKEKALKLARKMQKTREFNPMVLDAMIARLCDGRSA